MHRYMYVALRCGLTMRPNNTHDNVYDVVIVAVTARVTIYHTVGPVLTLL